MKIGSELRLHDFGSHQQRQLAKAREARLRRRIDNFDVIRLLQKTPGYGFLRTFAGDAGDLILKVLDVLKIDGCDDADAGLQEFLDFLPSMRVAAAGRIVVGKAVDQNHLRVTA